MKVMRLVVVLVIFIVFLIYVIAHSGLWRHIWPSSKKVKETENLDSNSKYVTDASGKRRRAVTCNPAALTAGSKNMTHVIQKSKGKPRFPNYQDAFLELDNPKYTCNDSASAECAARTAMFGELLEKELNRIVTVESNIFVSGMPRQNTYGVHFDGGYGRRLTRQELLCAVANVHVRTVTARDEPFASLGYPIPAAPLSQARLYNSCAVVSSAGAMLGSHLGSFIDGHDVIIRFNNAPTAEYSEDVGSKTTFRIINSQVVTKPEFNFLEDPLYSNISILIWDPAKYSSTLEDWYQSPDFPLFPIYKKFLELNPGADAHLLHPHVIWDLWTVLQSSIAKRIKKNPPSSGFLGIWLAMHRCANVRVFEYVPSSRATARCHYYSTNQDRACSLGIWHPLAQEKSLANQMRDNSNFEAYQRGFISIPGTVSFKCPG